MMLSERDYQLPWKRGIGNDACKIWDANGRLVCIMETSADSTFLVESINKVAQLETSEAIAVKRMIEAEDAMAKYMKETKKLEAKNARLRKDIESLKQELKRFKQIMGAGVGVWMED